MKMCLDLWWSIYYERTYSIEMGFSTNMDIWNNLRIKRRTYLQQQLCIPLIQDTKPLQWGDPLRLLAALSDNHSEVPTHEDMGEVISWRNKMTRERPLTCHCHRHEKTSMIDLVPTSSLMESKTDFVSPSLSLILSQFGGALGLWLGLGVTQLFQVQHSSIMSSQCLKTGGTVPTRSSILGSDCTTQGSERESRESWERNLKIWARKMKI